MGITLNWLLKDKELYYKCERCEGKGFIPNDDPHDTRTLMYQDCPIGCKDGLIEAEPKEPYVDDFKIHPNEDLYMEIENEIGHFNFDEAAYETAKANYTQQLSYKAQILEALEVKQPDLTEYASESEYYKDTFMWEEAQSLLASFTYNEKNNEITRKHITG